MEIRMKLPTVRVPSAADIKCLLGRHKWGMWIYHEAVFKPVNDAGVVDPSRSIEGIDTVVIEKRVRTCHRCGTAEEHMAMFY